MPVLALLMARTEAATVKGSVFSTDEFTGYNDPFGKHVPIDHRARFIDGEGHTGGIEGSRSHGRRLHRHCHGVGRENVPTYLAEYGFRYNHRDEPRPRILFDRLDDPRLIQGRLPREFPTHQKEEGRIRMGRIFEKRKESIFKTAAQKSKLYSKYGRQLYMAAKNGVPDPEGNPALRSLVEKAKRDNVANHVIEKAIQKAAGAGGEDFQAVRYEGFGPGGSLLIVDCLTDNNTRTIADVRSCFNKTGSKLSANGSVVLSFDHLAVLSFRGDDEEKVIEAMFAADVAVEDVECKDGTVTIFAPPAEFYKAKMALFEVFPGLELEVQEITFLPQASKTLNTEDLGLFEKLLGMLNDCDDVQEIYHNVSLPG